MENRIIIPRCYFCTHYLGSFKCRAFPKKIPDEIILGENDHSKPLPKQKNDIVFERIDNGENV